jgi:LacI family gluconate utilization system Gnt-I transcriptional repressor
VSDDQRVSTSYPSEFQGNATLADVSKLAGVSSMTVSRALNKPDLVSEKTLKKVQAAVDQLGYVPNLLAGGLVSRQSKLIAVLVPTIANSIFAEMIQALMDQLDTRGYHTVLGITQYKEDKEESLVNTLLGRRPDGIVLVGTDHSERTRTVLKRAGIPVVEAWDWCDDPIDTLVGFSHQQIGQSIAEFITQKQYRRCAIISVDDPRGLRRSQAIEAQLTNSACETKTLYLPTPATLHTGRQGLSVFLDEHGFTPDIVVCSSDTVAQGVMAEAQARNLSIPKDLAVLGFGNLSSAAFLTPSLSTVHLDSAKVGEHIAHALIARVEGGEVTPSRVDVGFGLIERNSTQTA